MRLIRFALVDQREHRLAHGLGAPHTLVGSHPANRARYQLDGRVRRDRPVRHEECACTSIEERTRQTRQGLRSWRRPTLWLWPPATTRRPPASWRESWFGAAGQEAASGCCCNRWTSLECPRAGHRRPSALGATGVRAALEPPASWAARRLCPAFEKRCRRCVNSASYRSCQVFDETLLAHCGFDLNRHRSRPQAPYRSNVLRKRPGL